MREHVGEFFRDLRGGLGGQPLPYVWVPELHEDGVHFHVHFAVGRFVPRRLIESAWGRGFVHIKLLSGLPAGSGALGESRKAAQYLSKYVTKSFTDPSTRAPGMHRYDLAQGFKPAVIRLPGWTVEEAMGKASDIMRDVPTARWSSADSERWDGPPSVWAQWGR
ncbi:hypothetical protein PU560_10615 [Georgenia sp. 10Sc9-8]|uniref:Replication-associated protein ORF2/G2P domain-containing protein n=1 Tax=Georgenia halotolerans TaxID=3028317 RepID=A0ABT5TXW6_9MICO|nr:hypothetical protein [Georgenia halotolerans]